MTLFTSIKKVLKFTQKHERPRVVKTVLNVSHLISDYSVQPNNRISTLPTYNRHVDQHNQTTESAQCQHATDMWISGEEQKTHKETHTTTDIWTMQWWQYTHWRHSSLFNKCDWKVARSYINDWKSILNFTLHKIISKWIKYLKTRPQYLKFWGKIFEDAGRGNSLLNS